MPKSQPSPARREPTLEDYEQLYTITFTDFERMLLREKTLLTPLDKQHRYLLQMALTPLKCPGCQGVICQRSAGWQTEETSRPDDAYECPFCHAKLTWGLALIGGDQWFTLNPGQTITVGEVPPSE
jgi:hypothetical protein